MTIASTLFLAAAAIIVHADSGRAVDVEALADDFARRDVVFLGELHDNDAGHAFQLEVVRALHRRRPDLVISMEMFERDVQGTVSDYVRGRIDEKTFLAHSRPWGNYRQHYRPIVEFARANQLDVIAGNLPKPLASRVSREGADAVAGLAHVPRAFSTAKDRYWQLFADAMAEMGSSHGHGPSDPAAVYRMYQAHCVKDDAMAESIADYLDQHRPRRPLVVHLCGRFHSDYGLGTVVRLLERKPLLQVGVVSTDTVAPEKVRAEATRKPRDEAHYVFLVAEKKKPRPEVIPPAKERAPETPGTRRVF